MILLRAMSVNFTRQRETSSQKKFKKFYIILYNSSCNLPWFALATYRVWSRGTVLYHYFVLHADGAWLARRKTLRYRIRFTSGALFAFYFHVLPQERTALWGTSPSWSTCWTVHALDSATAIFQGVLVQTTGYGSTIYPFHQEHLRIKVASVIGNINVK